MQSWPTGIPDVPLVEGFDIQKPYRDPYTTDMEYGPQRSRRSATLNVATLAYSIMMSRAQFTTFQSWVVKTLVDGNLKFAGRVWSGSAMVSKTCKILTFKPNYIAGTDKVVVDLSVDVEQYFG